MRVEVLGYQPRLAGPPVPIRRHIFDVPIPVLRKLADGERHECYTCGAPIYDHAFRHADGSGIITFEYWLGPWGSESKLEYYCSEHNEDAYEQDEVSFCEYCERYICNSNGARSYFKRPEDAVDICVGCWQASMLRYDTQAAALVDAFANGGRRIPCDFFNWDELLLAGFRRDQSFFLRSNASVAEVRRRIQVLRAGGLQVIIDQGPTSYMGDEGHVELWLRSPSEIPTAADTPNEEDA